MGSLIDYDKHYVKGPGQCGDPFDEFVRFFEAYKGRGASVLDLGCGQGRDALLAASYGHSVLGVDLSEVGLTQMLADAERQGLDVDAVVADVVDFKTRRRFDVVILDRVLHCLPNDDERRLVLDKACRLTKKRNSYILIADTPKHRALIRSYFSARQDDWDVVKRKGNFLFVRRSG